MSKPAPAVSLGTRPASRGAARIVAELLEAWNAHEVDRLAALHTLDYEGVDVGDGTVRRGQDGVRQWAERYLLAFPDLRFTLDDAVVEGSRAAMAWTAQGTHQGKLMNIPATGRAVSFRGMSLLAIQGGKVSRGLYVWDVAGLLRTLRLLPEL